MKPPLPPRNDWELGDTLLVVAGGLVTVWVTMGIVGLIR